MLSECAVPHQYDRIYVAVLFRRLCAARISANIVTHADHRTVVQHPESDQFVFECSRRHYLAPEDGTGHLVPFFGDLAAIALPSADSHSCP